MGLEARCPRCQSIYEAASALACPSCGALVPPHPRATPFERLGIEPARFEIDEKELERAWLQRSRAVHPDRFVKKEADERRHAAEQTAALNDALRALKDPFDRASWLVANSGLDVARLDQRMLMELMEARERAEESEDEKRAVVGESEARFQLLLRELTNHLRDLHDREALERAARALAEMKTLARLVSDLGGPRLIATLDER
jgi:Fe-S protein assembly co-chaperone HscB